MPHPAGQRPIDVALLDQLTAALRHTAKPVTTADLAARMPTTLHTHRAGQLGPDLCRDDHRIFAHHPYVDLVECRGPAEHLIRVSCTPVQVLPLLVHLQARGRVQHLHGRYGPEALWAWIPPHEAPGREDELELDRAFHAITTHQEPS